jgi:TonB family protein
MSTDDDDILASVNLDAWRVPPPRTPDRHALLSRVLSPAAPAARPRTRWVFAALAIANVVLAAIIVIVISQRSPETIVKLQPAGGGGDLDAQTQAALRRLEQEQRALEGKLADIEQLRTAVTSLAERVRQCEQTNKTVIKPRPVAPPPVATGSCDEVSCILNYEPVCCAKFRRPSPPPNTSATTARALPETLDRQGITDGVASIRGLIQACGQQHATAKGNVKVRVRVNPSGRVEEVLVESTPDPALGACVADVVRKAIFEPTFHGGAFSYPFVFGASP